MKKAARLISIPLAIALTALVVPFAGCGGGGGGGSGSGGGDGTLRRTTDTGVRVIHAAVALAPLDLVSGEETLQQAKYAQLTTMAEASTGPQILLLQRRNTPGGVFRNLNLDLLEKTEYTIFVYGGAFANSDNVTVLTEPITRPEPGFALVQFLNGYESSRRVDVSGAGLTEALGAQFGAGSGFRTITSGPQEFVFTSSSGELGRVSVDVPDRGEVTLVISGSEDLGFSQIRSYLDLD